MFSVGPRCKITSKTHRNRTRDDLRKTAGDDDFRRRNGGGETCRQGEWYEERPHSPSAALC
jgi:hypothetical protein